MLGAIIGDIAGSRFEFNNHRSKMFTIFDASSFVTDDTIMTLAVAQALKTSRENNTDLAAETVHAMQSIGRHYPNCGFGGKFYRWIFDDDPKPYHSFGNGAAMRVSPCALIAQSEAEAIELSRIVTAITHDHPEGIKGAEATTVAIYLAKTGATKSEIRERIERDYYKLDFTIDEIRPYYPFNETCQQTVPQAIQAFLESQSFDDAIRTAVSVGGDSDTLAAITGSIAEAYFGVAQAYEFEIYRYLDKRLSDLLDDAKEFVRRYYRPKPLSFLTKYISKFGGETGKRNTNDLLKEIAHFVPFYEKDDLTRYGDLLKNAGFEWSSEGLENADVSQSNEVAILALLVGAFRADHFDNGYFEQLAEAGHIERWLIRLKEIIDAQPVPEPAPMLIRGEITVNNKDQTETLTFTRDGLKIEIRNAVVGRVVHSVEPFGGKIAGDYVLALNRLSELALSSKWLPKAEGKFTGTYNFKLHAVFASGAEITYNGPYGRHFIPEDEWLTFVYHLNTVLNSCGYGNALRLDGFLEAIRPHENKFCQVQFSNYAKRLYHYRTDDPRIQIGDNVIVPAGENNEEREVTVVDIEYCPWDKTPYPIELTKKILRRADDKPVVPTTEEILRKIGELEIAKRLFENQLKSKNLPTQFIFDKFDEKDEEDRDRDDDDEIEDGEIN